MLRFMRPEILFSLFAPVTSLKGVGARVAPLLLQAIEVRPDSRLKKLTYSFHYIDYLPYYQLGRAAEGLGRAQEAIGYYSTELEKNEILGRPAVAEPWPSEWPMPPLPSSAMRPATSTNLPL